MPKSKYVLASDGKLYDANAVKSKIATSETWLHRAIEVLYERQTSDEKRESQTKYLNNRGFSAAHVKVLSYYLRWIKAGNKLSGRHKENAIKIVQKYSRQILEEMDLSAQRKRLLDQHLATLK